MKILLTGKIPDSGINKLKAFTDNLIVNDQHSNREKLLKKAEGCHAIGSFLSDKIDAEFMEAAGQNLKIIANYAVGYNNIDIEEAKKRDILVTNTPNVLTNATADLAWALIMAVTRRIVEADQYCRTGKFNGWGAELMLGMELTGKTLGILGAGRIGQATAKRAKAFDMDILYCSRHDKFKFEVETKAKRVGLEELMEKSDILSIHLPLVPETHHLIDRHELSLMKQTAYLINTGRGPIVNEEALVEILKSGNLAGAGLDVYEKEPDIHTGLIELDNTVLVPHIGSATVETRNKMALMVADNIISGLTDKIPPNLIKE